MPPARPMPTQHVLNYTLVALIGMLCGFLLGRTFQRDPRAAGPSQEAPTAAGARPP